MNINESVRDWIRNQAPAYSALDGVDYVTMGETDDLTPPFLGIYESGSSVHRTDDVIMTGVTDFEITCELHTVPADDEDDGTTPSDAQDMRQALYDIIGDRAAIDWMEDRNGWRVFDIRLSSPTTEPSEGRRVSIWKLSIVACPIY